MSHPFVFFGDKLSFIPVCGHVYSKRKHLIKITKWIKSQRDEWDNDYCPMCNYMKTKCRPFPHEFENGTSVVCLDDPVSIQSEGDSPLPNSNINPYVTGAEVAPGVSNVLFITFQHGLIRRYSIRNGVLENPPFLDLRSEIDQLMKLPGSATFSEERGLLGLAFHPDYSNPKSSFFGTFCVYYSTGSSNPLTHEHRSIIARYRTEKGTPRFQEQIMSIEEPEVNHNGGSLAFSRKDGYLYIGVGDGGLKDDLHGEEVVPGSLLGNGQDYRNKLGKILRISLNPKGGYTSRGVAPVGITSIDPDIYAMGLRNPWKMSFDSSFSRLIVGDVGQTRWEEIDVITEGGHNYGWRAVEGPDIFDKNLYDVLIKERNFTPPSISYPHSNENVAVIGGYVYQGKKMPHLRDYYIFGDWMGSLFIGDLTNNSYSLLHRFPDTYIHSFARDQNEELYVLGVKNGKSVLYSMGC